MQFEQGDVIEVRGRKYSVEDKSIRSDGTVLRYDLNPKNHDVIARLKPHSDGLTLIEYHDVTGKIQVNE